jgi:hypothetical protein
MISIDNTMSDMEQMEAVQAATAMPDEPEKPAGNEQAEALQVEAVEQSETESEDDGEDETGDTDAGSQKPKKLGGYQRQIQRLKLELAKFEGVQERLAQLELATRTGVKPAEREPAPIIEGKPTLDQFDGDLEKFTEALVEWKEGTRQAETKAKQQADTWQTRVAEAAKDIPDFDDYANVQIPLTPQMREFMVESEIGPKLGYALAKDLAEAQRIFGLPPLQQVKALAKLELELTGTVTPPVKQVTKASAAPPPIKPLAGGTSAPVVKKPSEMSFQEFVAWRNSGGK